MTSADSVGSLPHQSLLALVWTCFGTAFVLVALRTLIRFKIVDRLAAEDYWIFLALATLLTCCILETIQLPSLYYITGIIAGVIPVTEDLISYGNDYLRFEFPIIVLYWTVLWCVKASFLALYFKLFRELKAYRRVWYILATFTFLAYVGCWITMLTSCHPFPNFFKFGQCNTADDIWSSRMSVYYSTVIDVFTDVCSMCARKGHVGRVLTLSTVMAMPIRLIQNVKISLKQKAGLVCVFSLCFVMIVFSIIRAKQVLVEQYFVNLTLLMVWSTLAATMCEWQRPVYLGFLAFRHEILKSYSRLITTLHPAVIVGSLPAFRFLATSRAAAKRSALYGSSGGKGKPHVSNNSSLRSKSVPHSSYPISEKSVQGRRPSALDSHEEIPQPDDSHSIMVKSDVVSARIPSPVLSPQRGSDISLLIAIP
jgi:hypothetical protein